VDASVVAVGACAFQADVCGLEKPIAYMSQKLTPAQTKWSNIEREAFAVICALQKLHAFVFGVHTVVYSDHNPLTYVVNYAPKSALLTRYNSMISSCVTRGVTITLQLIVCHD